MVGKSDHEFVPVHEVLSEKEIGGILEKMGLKKENLPKIFASDPQAKRVGAKAGQVIRVSREDAGNKFEYYRLVIES